jgi:hypothetical protein
MKIEEESLELNRIQAKELIAIKRAIYALFILTFAGNLILYGATRI